MSLLILSQLLITMRNPDSHRVWMVGLIRAVEIFCWYDVYNMVTCRSS